MTGQFTEVRGDGCVGSRGDEEAAETEGVMGISRKEKRRSNGVWVMESVESGDEKNDDEEESTEWRWLMPEREY